MKSDCFDIAIIGAGSAGLIGADFAARIGAKVALIERDRIGGDCTWTGCVPSKALLHAARLASDARRAPSFGIELDAPRTDMRGARQRVHATISEIYANTTPEALQARGIDVFLGPASFHDSRTILVGDRRIEARHIVICTGARPKVPDLPGLNTVPFLTYDRLFELDQLPGHLIVLGAGPLGAEMAQAFVRLGAAVTLIGPRLLAREEPGTQTLMRDVLQRDGIKVVLARGTSVRAASGIEVATDAGAISGSHLLVAAGRAPRVDGLNLERAGIQYGDGGIPVDRYLRTNVRHVFACGDVVGGAQFSHLAGWQCFRAVRNALLPGKSAAEAVVMPAVTFTDPEVARVGLIEKDARDSFGDSIRVHTIPITKADRAVCDGEPHGFIKLITNRRGKIVGSTIVATRAGEMIAEVALAMQHNLGVDAIAETIHAYPTWSSATQFAAVDVMMSKLESSLSFRLARRVSGLMG